MGNESKQMIFCDKTTNALNLSVQLFYYYSLINKQFMLQFMFLCAVRFTLSSVVISDCLHILLILCKWVVSVSYFAGASGPCFLFRGARVAHLQIVSLISFIPYEKSRLINICKFIDLHINWLFIIITNKRRIIWGINE